jgi:hypothetical protein
MDAPTSSVHPTWLSRLFTITIDNIGGRYKSILNMQTMMNLHRVEYVYMQNNMTALVFNRDYIKSDDSK